jgi:hypothetical protein
MAGEVKERVLVQSVPAEQQRERSSEQYEDLE